MIKKNAKNIILVLFVVITGIFYIDSFMKHDTFESRNIILEGQGVERI